MGLGVILTLHPFHVEHGTIDALGFRLAIWFICRMSLLCRKTAWIAVQGAKCWIVDALRRAPHPTHSHLDQTLEWINRAGVERGVLTNMHIDLDYATRSIAKPPHILISL